jgi:kumamolisin
MRRSIGLLAVAATVLLSFARSVPAQEEASAGALIIPNSSVEHRNDIGVRAHSNVRLFFTDGAVNPASSPGATSETPASLACVYNLVKPVQGCPISGTTTNPSGGSGAIAIVDAYDDPNAADDLATFSSFYGLPTANFNVVYASGTKPPVDSSGGWELEESLDIEWAHAMAPNAEIFLVEANSNSYNDLFAAENVAASLVAGAGGGEVSNSWSGSEFSSESRDDSNFRTTGVVYLASTGDSAFALGYPAVSPYVVAVGGTSLKYNASNGKFNSEWYWDNQYGGGGGGLSQFEKTPPYQSGISNIVGTHRGVPDVSSDADPVSGAAVYDSYPYSGVVYGWLQVGGTSFSCPTWAGILNSAGHFYTKSSLELNTIYADYAGARYANQFRDITKGSSSCTTGWDICTGVGSPLTYAGK